MSRTEKMMGCLPAYYQNSRVMRSIVETLGTELDGLRAAIQAVLKQLYANTADDWGIELWEKELALPPGDSETLEERRQRIISRMRGYGTATIKAIKNVAESYDKGVIDVAEDYSTYTVIRFIDTTGIPSNIEDLKAIVREVVPAHLALGYEFNYFIWDELDEYMWTWDQLDSLNLIWDTLEVYK